MVHFLHPRYIITCLLWTHHECRDTPLDTLPLETALDILHDLTQGSVDAPHTENISRQDLTEMRGL